MRTYVALALVCLTLVSGCTADQNWGLTVTGHLDEGEEEYIFDGEVRLGGKLGGVNVEGTQVRFLNEANETMKLVQVGTLNDTRPTVDLDVPLQDRPTKVLVEVHKIDTPSDADYGVAGLSYRDGAYYPYTNYDPFVD